MTTTATFSALAETDFDILKALAERIWRQHYIAIVGEAQVEYMLAGRYTPDKLSAYLGADDCWMQIVRESGEAIGYFSWSRVSAEEMKLEQLYLLAERRGGGLGRRMMAHVEEHARRQGCTRLMLTVNRGNTQSLRIYEKSGFTVREEKQFDIGNGFVMDDYVMVKAI
jgi:diamine N-acetyltransferase